MNAINLDIFAESQTKQGPVKDPLLAMVQELVNESVNDLRMNRLDDWERYERAYRLKFNETDRSRASERSKFISDVTASAVESSADSMIDAMFGQGLDWLTIEDDIEDTQRVDVEKFANKLKDRMNDTGVVLPLMEAALAQEIYGTAIIELVVRSSAEYVPTQQGNQFGVVPKKRVQVMPRFHNPRNFRIGAHYRTIQEAPRVAIEEYVPAHQIKAKMDSKQFLNAPIEHSGIFEQETRNDTLNFSPIDGMCLMTRCWGLFPRHLIDSRKYPADSVKGKELVESIVYVLNRAYVVRAQESPYMCQDRPVFALRPDLMPGVFWGRGSAEKVDQFQRASDAMMRSHFDSLALTAAPMMGVNAAVVPRGFDFTVRPGRTILVNGNPKDVLQPLTLGEVKPELLSSATWLSDRAKALIGSTPSVSQVADAKAGPITTAMTALVKKTKRSLLIFEHGFVKPFVKGIAYRYMQFDAQDFPSADLTFDVSGLIGMLQMEQEHSKYMHMLQTLGPESPVVPAILSKLVKTSNMSDKEELAEFLVKAANDKAEHQKFDQSDAIAKEVALRLQAAQASKLEAEATEAQAKALLNHAEALLAKIKAEMEPERIQADIFQSLVTNTSSQIPDDQEFEQRLKVMDLAMKEMSIRAKDLDRESNERIATMQMSHQPGSSKSRLGALMAELEQLRGTDPLDEPTETE